MPSYGGGLSESRIHPAVLVAMIVVIILMFVLPRKHVIGPFLLSVFLIPLGQQLYIGGVHWLAPRIIVLFAFMRVLMLRRLSAPWFSSGGVNSVDRAFLGCVICQAVGFILQFMDSAAVVNQCGIVIDFIGAYCVLRVLIVDESDIYRSLKYMAFACAVLAVCMVREQLTLENVFGLLGGTRIVPDVREGKIRSQAAFQHSLTAGVLGATLLPLFYLLWKNGKAKATGALGMFGCTVMTICSNSSTPLLAYAAGVAGLGLWAIRSKMRTVRRGLAVTLVVLHLVMSAPVWFLIARIDLTGGSSGYHRAALVDQFIRHFSDWWLIGTKDSGTWGYDMWDQQNEYVSVGETGGLAALVLFIAVISGCFSRAGIGRQLAGSKRREWTFWLLGSSLFANIVGFFGVNYFDQAKVGWMMLIAMIIAATQPSSQALNVTETKAEPTPAAGATDDWWGAVRACGDEGRLARGC